MGYLDDIKRKFDDLKQQVEEYRQQLYRLENRLSEFREYAEKSRKYLRSDESRQNAFTLALEESYPEAKILLTQFVTDALIKTQEFDFEPYRSDIILACQKDHIFLVSRKGNKVTVKIDMDSAAGRIEEYAQAVSATRGDVKTLGKRHLETGEHLPSRIWREKIYSVDRLGKTVEKAYKKRGSKTVEIRDITERYAGKYFETMGNRRRNFPSLAPWWSILDKGTAMTSEVFGGDGVPFPSYGPTNFVNNALTACQNLFQNSYNKFHEEILTRMRDEEKYYKDRAASYEETISRLNEELAVILEQLEEEPEDIIREVIYMIEEHLGEAKAREADTDKLYGLAIQLINGQAPDRVWLGSGVQARTVELGREIRAALRNR